MFYLTMHSTHFILQLNGVRNMVKDHSDSERGNPINSKGSFICITDRIAYTTALGYSGRGALAGTRMVR